MHVERSRIKTFKKEVSKISIISYDHFFKFISQYLQYTGIIVETLKI